MENYTIYCTEEQVLSALMLGAPIREVGSESDAKKCLQHSKNYRFYEVPTAETMIGWLETQGELRIEIGWNRCWWCYTILDNNSIVEQGIEYQTRKEATLAAIDGALDYLNKTNK